MPIPSDYRDIVNVLLEKTDRGDVHWRKEKFDIAVAVEGSRFSIWAGNDEHTEEPFVAFALQDENGATLDSWYVEENEGPPYNHMYRLYVSAKRQALGIPVKLKKLRDLLSTATVIGKPDAE